MSSNGTVIINIPEGIAHNSVGNSNKSATFFDNIVSFNGQNLYVEITLAEGQINPTNEATVHFTATFSENVNDFTSSDVSFWGTANPENVSISGNGITSQNSGRFNLYVNGSFNSSGNNNVELANLYTKGLTDLGNSGQMTIENLYVDSNQGFSTSGNGTLRIPLSFWSRLHRLHFRVGLLIL